MLIVLIYLAGIISSLEFAIFSFNSEQRQELEKNTDKKSLRILSFINAPNYLVFTALISKLVFFIGMLYAGLCILAELEDFVSINQIVLLLIVALVLVILKVGFVEILPKSYALKNNMKLAHRYVNVAYFLSYIFRPLIRFFIRLTDLIESKLKKYNKNQLSVELNQAIEHIKEKYSEPNKLEEKDLLRGIVQFGDTSVSQVMCSRVDVVYVDVSSNFRELLSTVRESGYSRIPVCKDDLDRTIGVLYAKDLLRYLDEEDDFEWLSLIRPALFIPESKKIDALLEEFRAKRVHLAIVVDEYGGTSGIISMEDILEEIIGEIKDEFDDLHEIDFRKVDDNTFIFEGKTSINDVCKMMNIDSNIFEDIKKDADTIAGLVLETKGDLPTIHEEVTIENYTFKVLEINMTRIVKIKITRHES